MSVFSWESLVKPNPITSLLVERVVAAELTRPDSKAVMNLRRSVQQRFGERVSGEAVLDAIRQVFLAPATAVEARVEDEPAKGTPRLHRLVRPSVLLVRLGAGRRYRGHGWLPRRPSSLPR